MVDLCWDSFQDSFASSESKYRPPPPTIPHSQTLTLSPFLPSPTSNRTHPPSQLSVSHAIAQSTKLSVYESVMQESLALTASFPKELAMTGELKLSRKGALKITGRIFRLRMEVNLSSGILGEFDE